MDQNGLRDLRSEFGDLKMRSSGCGQLTIRYDTFAIEDSTVATFECIESEYLLHLLLGIVFPPQQR